MGHGTNKRPGKWIQTSINGCGGPFTAAHLAQKQDDWLGIFHKWMLTWPRSRTIGLASKSDATIVDPVEKWGYQLESSSGFTRLIDGFRV